MDLALNCINQQIAALNNLREVVQTNEYAKIVQLVTNIARLNHKHKVLIAGVGKNAAIASKISDTMVSLGIPSYPLNVSHLGHGDYGRIGPHDAIIHISRSGETQEMLDAIQYINSEFKNVSQVLIHCKSGKPRNPNVEVELFIGGVVEGDEFNLAPTTSTTALLCVLDCISVQASSAMEFKRTDFLRFHPSGALGKMLKQEQENK